MGRGGDFSLARSTTGAFPDGQEEETPSNEFLARGGRGRMGACSPQVKQEQQNFQC